MPVMGQSRTNIPGATACCMLVSDPAVPVAVQRPPSFHSGLSAEKSSSRSSEVMKDPLSMASSSSSSSAAQQPSATVSMLNTLLASSLSLLPPEDPTSYAMGVPLGFRERLKSEANPRLVASPIARSAMERSRLCDDDTWLALSQHYYVERQGARNKIWRLLQSLK